MSRQALIFGAGKIGRGFLAHLLTISGYELTFVDASESLVARLNAAGCYKLNVLGASEKNTVIDRFKAIASSDAQAVHHAVASHDLLFTAAGGANLQAVGALIAGGLKQRLATRGKAGTCDIIICENYKQPAKLLREAIESKAEADVLAWTRANLGIAETQVLRSCIDPTPELVKEDPLSLQVQDWWALPCDAEAFRGTAPDIKGLALKPQFQNELIRKLYTYNCSNAVIGYIGHLRGHTMLHEAANDPDILAIAQQAYDETGEALIREFGFDREEHRQLQQLALTKYRDTRIADPIERNCRDSKRKLSSTDRLVGPALLAVKHGVMPRAVSLGIAAAMYYDGSDDPGTKQVREVVSQSGVETAITQFCGIDAKHPLFALIVESVSQLKTFTQDHKHTNNATESAHA